MAIHGTLKISGDPLLLVLSLGIKYNGKRFRATFAETGRPTLSLRKVARLGNT
jgi:hypothetical protein